MQLRDLKATDHQTWPLFRSGREDESSIYFGETQVSAVPHGWQHQRSAELAGGTFQQPTQEAAGILTVDPAAPDQPRGLQHKPACILPTSYRAAYSSLQKALWHFDRRSNISETFLAAAPVI